ncbi:MAG: hypothetical protein K6F32_02205, partial [Bacilli bacterium]|nr:hypothetical protein [Bacilli bacterium]
IIRGSEMFDEMPDSDILANVVAFSLPNSRKISYLPDGVDPKDYDFAVNFGILAKQAQEEGRCIDGDPEHIGLAAFDIVFGYLSRRILLGKNQKSVMAEVLRNLVTK